MKRLALLLSVLALADCAGGRHTFHPGDGWKVGMTRAEGWAIRGQSDCGPCLPGDLGTLKALRADGIAISLGLGRSTHDTAGRTWPPRVMERRVSGGGLEGVPATIGVFQWTGRAGHRDAYVLILFGRAKPTRQQLAQANAELRSAKLP